MGPEAVIFLSTRAPWPPVTGHFIRTYRTLQALSACTPVHFVGFYDRGLSPEAEQAVNRELSKLCASVTIHKVASEQSRSMLLRDLVAATLQLKPFVALKYYSRELKRKVEQLQQQYPRSVVWADMLPLAEYLKGLSPESTVLTMHNIESTRLQRLAEGRKSISARIGLRVQAALLARYEKRQISRLRHCVAVSEEDAAMLRSLAPGCDVAVVPNGAELRPVNDAAQREKRPTAIWVGGMSDPYNGEAVDYFSLKILPELISRIPGFQWIVVGGSPSKAVLDACERYPGTVQVMGFVDDLDGQYARAHVAVIPLRSGAGTKLKVLEAMGRGVAIVTTQVGAEGLGATDGVDLSIADTDNRFIDEVCRLMSDWVASDAQAAAALDLIARKFQWPLIEGQMREVLYHVGDKSRETGE